MAGAVRVRLEAMARALPPRLEGQNKIVIQETLEGAVNEVLEQIHTDKWN
jgi:hypothetical protein